MAGIAHVSAMASAVPSALAAAEGGSPVGCPSWHSLQRKLRVVFDYMTAHDTAQVCAHVRLCAGVVNRLVLTVSCTMGFVKAARWLAKTVERVDRPSNDPALQVVLSCLHVFSGVCACEAAYTSLSCLRKRSGRRDRDAAMELFSQVHSHRCVQSSCSSAPQLMHY